MVYKGSKFFLVAFGIFVVLAIVSFLVFSNSRINPNIILDLKGSYEEGEIFKGNLEINLKSGEFIPASSKVIFVNEGVIYEYVLRDLIEKSPVEGEYYLEGSQISGFGEGYGVVGTKEIYPDVYFKINIYLEKKNEDKPSEKNKSKEVSDEGEEDYIEEGLDEGEEEVEEGLDEEEEEVEEGLDEGEEEVEESLDEEESLSENQESSPFEGFSITGQVSLKFEKEVQGDVAYGEEFIYLLGEKETVELVNGSIRTETKYLSSNDLDLKIKSGELVITTNYFEEEKGFGQEYLQNNNNNNEFISINISSLNLIFEEGDLKIYVFYEDEEIISFETILRNKIPVSPENISEEFKKNESKDNITDFPLSVFNFNIENVSLTEEEKSILFEKFPNKSIQRSAREYKEWILVEFKLLEYSVEHSYDSSLDYEVIEKLMEKDRIMWMKDLARKFLKDETFSEELINFTEDYNLI